MTIQQAFEVAHQHHLAGRLAEAEALYRQILAREPRHAESLHFLGVIAHQVGRHDVAVDLIRQAIALQPDFPQALNNLGLALKEKGNLDEAIAAYRQAIALQPGTADAHYNLGIALYVKGEADEAIAEYRQALALKPEHGEAHNNLGVSLYDKGQLDKAIAEYRQVLAVNPDHPEAHCNLGLALKDKGELDEAIAACRRAIALKPGYPDAYNNLGNALVDKGQFDEAVAVYLQGIAIQPGYPDAHWNLGLTLLMLGNFTQGWREYEWRWQSKDFSPPRDFVQPQWDGRPLEGRTILLHAEQGFGDTVQFIRYLPLVMQRGGKIIIECQPELRRLLQGMSPDLPVVAYGQPLPAFAVHCPLMSLPYLFSTDLTNVPANAPYLQADAVEAGLWRDRLAAGAASSFKVGLVWAGRPTHKNDRNRSLKLAGLAPLADVSGVQFYSLQKGDAATEARTPPRGMELVDVAEELKDFADTAALIANLDLVIAVDTAVVHLAGAIGKPVWLLLPFVPDWRWLLARADCPWYPTMRLFRQPRIGDWDAVIAEVSEQLRVRVRERRGAS